MESTTDTAVNPRDALADAELKARLGAAIVDDDQEQVVAIEAELDRRARDATRQQLADEEPDRRRIQADRIEHDELIEKWASCLPAMEAENRRRLDDLNNRSDLGEIRAVYALGRALYSLRHDLSGVDPTRFKRPHYGVPSDLSLAAGAAADLFLASIRGKPPVISQPWKLDVDRARMLVPPPESAIKNGG